MKEALRLSPLLVLISAVVAFGSPSPVHTDVFTSGTGGYNTYRIPAIVAASDGSVLVFAEARKDNRHDPGGGDIDLVVKRSTDQGATWSAMTVLDDPGEQWSASNPVPLLDTSNGRVWIFYNRWEPGFGTELSQPGTANNQTWARHSDNHGRTWSAPIDLTRVARDFDDWGAIFLGPGGGIQSRTGRLLVPAAMRPDTFMIWNSSGDSLRRQPFMRSYVLYSDDHGKLWQRGTLIKALTDENQLVELADGAILMDARQSAGDHRWVAVSSDGGQTWSIPRAGQRVSPVATSIERHTLQSKGDDRNRILWTGPTGPSRQNLVIRVSYDEGQTFVNEKVIYGGLAAYSDLTILKDKSVGVIWERGISQGYQFITFTHLSRDFVD